MEKKKLSKRIFFGWPTLPIATSITAVLLGYVTFYATDFMGIPAATAGLIFMISKIFDGITDLIAGYVIDRTHSKLGKGRPYQLALIGYTLTLGAIFWAPDLGISGASVYLFVMYSLVNSVFMTLLSCSDAVYLANALDDPSQSVSLLAFQGFISLVFTMVASIILPQLVSTIGTTKAGWRLISAGVLIPCTLIGLIRFFVVKERKDVAASSQNVSIKEMISLLAKNKYILIFAVVILVSNIGSNIGNGVGTYYFQYIMHDIGLASIMSLSMLAIIIVIIMTPILTKKFSFIKIMRVTTLIGVFGYLLRLINLQSIPLLFVSSLLALMGFNTMFAFAGTFVINCMDYGEWKNGIRTEGTITAAQSFCAKIGTAVGSGLIGLLMGISGYVGAAEVQTASANTMIVMLSTVIPAIFCLIQYIFLRMFDLDKYMDQIQADLAKRRAAKMQAEI